MHGCDGMAALSGICDIQGHRSPRLYPNINRAPNRLRQGFMACPNMRQTFMFQHIKRDVQSKWVMGGRCAAEIFVK